MCAYLKYLRIRHACILYGYIYVHTSWEVWARAQLWVHIWYVHIQIDPERIQINMQMHSSWECMCAHVMRVPYVCIPHICVHKSYICKHVIYLCIRCICVHTPWMRSWVYVCAYVMRMTNVCLRHICVHTSREEYICAYFMNAYIISVYLCIRHENDYMCINHKNNFLCIRHIFVHTSYICAYVIYLCIRHIFVHSSWMHKPWERILNAYVTRMYTLWANYAYKFCKVTGTYLVCIHLYLFEYANVLQINQIDLEHIQMNIYLAFIHCVQIWYVNI